MVRGRGPAANPEMRPRTTWQVVESNDQVALDVDTASIPADRPPPPLQHERRDGTREVSMFDEQALSSTSSSYNDDGSGEQGDWTTAGAVTDVWSGSDARGGSASLRSFDFDFDFGYLRADAESTTSDSHDFSESESSSNSFSGDYEYAQDTFGGTLITSGGASDTTSGGGSDSYGGFQHMEFLAVNSPRSDSSLGSSLSDQHASAWACWDDNDTTSNSNSAEYAGFPRTAPNSVSDTTELAPWSHGSMLHNPIAASSITLRGKDRMAPAAPSGRARPTRQREVHQKPASIPRAQVKKVMEWTAVYDLLTGRVANTYPLRPYTAQTRAVRQIFFERPPQRRGEGGDRWRNSGGATGSAIHWITTTEGVRKRYGQLVRADRTLKKLTIMQFSLVRRGPGETVQEDKSAYVFTIEPCQLGEAETSEPPVRRPGLHPTASADAGEVTAQYSAAGIAVLDFDMLKGRSRRRAQPTVRSGSARSKRRRPLPVVSDSGDLLSEFAFDGGDLQPKKAKQNGTASWPFGQATLLKATLLSLALMAFSGYMMATGWQFVTTPSASSLCDAQSFRPTLSEHTDCIPCQDCASQGLEMLFKCSAVANACVLGLLQQPAFICRKASLTQGWSQWIHVAGDVVGGRGLRQRRL